MIRSSRNIMLFDLKAQPRYFHQQWFIPIPRLVFSATSLAPALNLDSKVISISAGHGGRNESGAVSCRQPSRPHVTRANASRANFKNRTVFIIQCLLCVCDTVIILKLRSRALSLGFLQAVSFYFFLIDSQFVCYTMSRFANTMHFKIGC